MNKNILRLALPNIISNITVPLLGMIDMFIVGHLSSELYIGAIAIAVMIFNLMYWSFSFLRMGTSGFTAQAYGARDSQEAVNILLRSLLVAALGSLAILFLQYFILQTALYFIQSSPEVMRLASDYFYIYVWAAPAVLGTYAFMGWFIGMQDAKTPMYISIAVNIINILLSIFLVFVLRWELKGVALASTLAQWSGFLLCNVSWIVKYKRLRSLISARFIKNIRELVPFFKVNSDIFIRTLCLITVSTFFTSASAKFGDITLAVNSLMMQLFILFSYMMDGFAYAAEALTGRFIGEQNNKALKQLINRLFGWGFGLTSFFTLLYFLFSDSILGLLTDKQSVLDMANLYINWVLLIPVAGFSAFLWDGIFIGMMASKQMRNSMFVAMISFFVIYYFTNNMLANDGLWLAFITYLGMRGIIQALIFRKIKYKIGL
ncbi:MATE family efflux transporter [Bacteroides propionicifaciens]|jgi:multidrug resistance protein, MATE family|uniref:MATE family efflux transporter n=1 Tax=Bacteroides propionicifaciens TaxID=392838 RepID=UPI000366E86E|nr:MATE family efflux transporter [Bacteroides propionicifaciens]